MATLWLRDTLGNRRIAFSSSPFYSIIIQQFGKKASEGLNLAGSLMWKPSLNMCNAPVLVHVAKSLLDRQTDTLTLSRLDQHLTPFG